MRLKDILEEFLLYSYQKHSKSLTDSYKRNLDRFVELTGDKELEELTLRDVLDFSEHIQKQLKLADSTRHQHLVSVRQFMLFASDIGQKIPFRPSMIPLPKYVNKDRPACTPEELHLMLSQKVGTSYMEIIRNQTIMLFLFATGLRVSELCDLTLDDVDLYKKQGTVISKKTYDRHIIFWDDNTNQQLKSYLEEVEPYRQTKFLFVSKRNGRMCERSIQRNFEKAREGAKLDRNITPHCLRHGFATFGIENGAEIYDMKTLLGHSSITSTERYHHKSNPRLKKKYEKIFNRSPQSIPSSMLEKLAT